MKYEIVKFTADHARSIIERNLRDGVDATPPCAETTIRLWEVGGPSYTVVLDDIPVCCGGITNLGFGRGEAWTLISREFYTYRKTCYEAVKFGLDALISTGLYRRIQSTISPKNAWGDSWMRHLGFTREGVLTSYGMNGEDVVMYARTL